METVAGIILIVSLFGNFLQHQIIRDQEDQIENLSELNEHNANQASIAAQAARDNGVAVESIGTDLDVCVGRLESYRAKELAYEYRRRADSISAQELEDIATNSDLSSCRVPDRLVDEIAGDGH